MPSAPAPSAESHWDPWLISLVIAICIIFLLFSYYKILKQLCSAINGVIFSRSRDPRQLLNEANPDDDSLRFYSHGLESAIIYSFPITQFKKKNEQELNPSNTECAVCLGEFEEGEWLKHLPNCSHAFHISCIDTWFQSHSNCPLCRSNVYDLGIPHECSVSMYTLLETLRREDFYQERATHYQILRTAVLHNPTLRYESTDKSNSTTLTNVGSVNNYVFRPNNQEEIQRARQSSQPKRAFAVHASLPGDVPGHV